MQAVDQRLEDKGEPVRHTEEPTMNTFQNNNYQYWSMKIDVPRFDITYVFGWIFKIEHFFQFYNTHDDQRIWISSFHLEGPTLSWFKWMHSSGFIESWKWFLRPLISDLVLLCMRITEVHCPNYSRHHMLQVIKPNLKISLQRYVAYLSNCWSVSLFLVSSLKLNVSYW